MSLSYGVPAPFKGYAQTSKIERIKTTEITESTERGCKAMRQEEGYCCYNKPSSCLTALQPLSVISVVLIHSKFAID
jgi:hypothetical protein